MKLGPVSVRVLSKILEKAGFQLLRQKGSHLIFRSADGRHTVIPQHSGEDIGGGLLRRILKEAELSREEFKRLKDTV